MAVIQLAAKRAVAPPLIEGVVARNANDRSNEEDAWVSMVTAANDHVLVVEFKAENYGEEAWPRAVKYGRGFSQRLGVAFRKKRGLVG